MNYIIVLIITSAVIIGFLINYLIYRRIVAVIVRRFLTPYLASRALKLNETRFTGLFNNGDFNDEGLGFNLVPEMGRFSISTYIYVFAGGENNQTIRFTAKIQVRFLFIRKVFLKGKNLKEIELAG
ncbi:hypothetical protein DBR40_03585 [Pedobacter sp. KBW01]|uniref:hypothetical protein n=1 Tax=Pedobacter sp. KBW01 TaxID=2153364 RepID=UPI000F591793|nr:hypothetical protein [Pedobacter sp. KBW01]RQO79447.1 hypothetical protein DBR40_03585 [Pedobacter sp. KBW01]